MALSEVDDAHLARCVDLADLALAAGDEPFGSLLVSGAGVVLLEERNHVGGGDGTRHPELALAQWAAARLPLDERAASTVYTSGEHCPMCAAAHGWAGLGRVVVASTAAQLSGWLAALGEAPGPVAALPFVAVVPGAVVDGPSPLLAERVHALHRRHRAGSA